MKVGILIRASKAEVWDAISDIADHVSWMADAEAITFTSERTSGVGTTFDCDTRVGPFRLTDRMEITEWDPGRTMGVRHVGMVSGTGQFRLKRRPGGTLFLWEERLVFPRWMGGAVGRAVATPLLHRLWLGNLRRLKARVERRPVGH
ncbi:MAG: Polyketide cyclase / dehydrase and lipid transport [Acidimicrobiales bacterium]|jgi:hypothetical protein|nr:Polyketide cyclase / dehydrase and lipid transport [Acidimicrobiales bacterium]